MYLILIILPLLGSISSGLFGRKIGIRGSQLITSSCVIITTILAIAAFKEVGINDTSNTINTLKMIDIECFKITWSFNFDSLTVSMLIPVLIVSSIVHIYSIEYMSHDPHNQRFFSYLSLFTFMMIILTTGNNLILMFVGWEGVGVCSYLLVSFWFTRIAANQSSMSAFLTNRVGDCVLTIGLFAALWSFGNIDYSTVFSCCPFYSENVVIIISICLLVGAMAKSSQVGLHVWLPLAMEGPTPVSALIHAATMVTAGVYLLIRTSPLIEYSSSTLTFCLWIGAITTLFSSLVGLFQQDIKKVIAYSTMSQLGMMVIAVGLSTYNVALFHLVNHAFYKALLFLGAGAVIHAVADNQDFRKYGGLTKYLPLTYSVMLIACFSLIAIPFMSGFYSKDLILESAYGQFKLYSFIVYFISIVGAIFTTLYSIKVLYLTFLSNPSGPKINYKYTSISYQGNIFTIIYRFLVRIYYYKNTHIAQEGGLFIMLPLIILALFSVLFGYLTKDIFIGFGSGLFSDNSLFIHPLHEIILDTEFFVPIYFKLLPLFFIVCFTFIFLIFTEFYPYLLVSFKLSSIGYNIFSFFNQRFFMEFFYNKYISAFVFLLGHIKITIMDKGFIELIGPLGLESSLLNLSKLLDSFTTTVVTDYGIYIFTGLIFYVLLFYSMPYFISPFIHTPAYGYIEGDILCPFFVKELTASTDPNVNSFLNYLRGQGEQTVITFWKNGLKGVACFGETGHTLPGPAFNPDYDILSPQNTQFVHQLMHIDAKTNGFNIIDQQIGQLMQDLSNSNPGTMNVTVPITRDGTIGIMGWAFIEKLKITSTLSGVIGATDISSEPDETILNTWEELRDRRHIIGPKSTNWDQISREAYRAELSKINMDQRSKYFIKLGHVAKKAWESSDTFRR
jgi:NADH-ubiquinone oxidoreductase chain 5